MADNHSQTLLHIKEQLFTAKTLYRELHQQLPELRETSNKKPEQGNNGQSLVFNDLVQLAQDNPQINALRVMQHINQSIPLRRQYMQLLQKVARGWSLSRCRASSSTSCV